MDVGDVSPLTALRNRSDPPVPAAGGRYNVRGDLGDAGRNRVRRARHGLDSEGAGDGFEGVPGPEFLSDTGSIDEFQVKALFTEFVKTFGAVAGTSSVRQHNSAEHDDFDVDLEGMAGGRTRHRHQAGGSSPGAATNPKYLAALRRVVEGGESGDGDDQGLNNRASNSFPVDLKDVKQFNSTLLHAIVREPANCIVFMDEVLLSIVMEEFPHLGQQGASAVALRVCLNNHPRVCCMRDLNPSDIESLIAIRGVVIRASHVIPDMQVAVFRCTARVSVNQTTRTCGHEEECRLANGEVLEPLRCSACDNKFSFELCHTKCIFGNKQLLKLQETPESIPEGETPHTVMAYAYDELVDVSKPGDRVELTGIYKASGVRVLAKQRNLKAVYRTYIDVNHIGKERLTQYQLTEEELDGGAARPMTQAEFDALEHQPANSLAPRSGAALFSEQTARKLRAIGTDPDIYENLVKSLAPNIWEHDDIKKGLLCQLFGGTAKQLAHRAARAEAHILLCGDPSTAKSQLLQYVNNIAPRGVYTCGRGTSAVGLTASVTRDVETREFVLESGAIVLSDRGICCIDEFDKMDDGARIILHEVMEQQTVSIAKAGIVCSVNARTSILASANPVNSKYDTRRSVVENINLPPTLLSRFDLIYLMLDNNNEELDRRLATHLCSLYAPEELQPPRDIPIPREVLSQYISYARSTCFPRLSDPAGQELASTYLHFRRKGADSSGKSLSATPRQLESLIRISESLAKMQLSDIVTVDHVKEAARLIQVATYNAIVDPLTGRIDFEQLNRGISGAARERREGLEKAVLEVLAGESGGLDKDALLKRVEEQLLSSAPGATKLGFSKDSLARELEQCLRNLELMGTTAKTHGGKYVSHS